MGSGSNNRTRPDEAVVKTVAIDDISIAYRDFGSGNPLVLISGFASTMDMWNPPVLAALAEHFRVIIFDNRGTGYTPSSDMPFSIELFAHDTASFLDALHISRAHILGHSMGASIAQELVLARPDLADRLILVSAQCGGPEAVQMLPEVKTSLFDKSGTAMEMASRMFSILFPQEWLASHDPWKYCPEVHETVSEDSAARQAEAFFSWPGRYDRLPEIRSPTLIVTGADDVIIPPENSSILGKRIPGAEVISFPGGGHGLMYQFPEEFARTVLPFLEGAA